MKAHLPLIFSFNVLFFGLVAGSFLDEPYRQFTSSRMVFPSVASFPSQWLQLPRDLTGNARMVTCAPSASTNTDLNKFAWLLMDTSLWMVDSLGGAKRIDGNMLNIKITPGTSMAVYGSTALVATPTEVLMAECTHAAACTVVGRLAGLAHWSAVADATVRNGPEGWVATESGVYHVTVESKGTAKVVKVAALPGYPKGSTAFVAVAVSPAPNGGVALAAATDEAVFFTTENASDVRTWRHSFVGNTVESAPTSLAFAAPPPSARGAFPPAQNTLWLAQDADALGALPPSLSWSRVAGGARGLLPLENVTHLASAGRRLWGCGLQGCMAYDPLDADGDLRMGAATPAVGAGAGSIAGNGPGYRVFAGPRWLTVLEGSDGAAVSVAAQAPAGDNGSIVWVLTKWGLACIEENPRYNLKDKLAAWQARIPAHSRYNYIAGGTLEKWGDLASLRMHDGDNDGSDNAQYVAAMAYKYAVTKDPEVKRAVWPHFLALEFLHNVTGMPGMVARTVVRCGESHQEAVWYNSTACYAGVDPPDAKKCCWTWKGDTSSDEIDGHVWALRIVHDLLMDTAKEKERAARLVTSTVAYIVECGYALIDKSGRRTKWGFWDPATLNGNPDMSDERGLNSLEMLTYLIAAHKLVQEHPGLPGPANFSFAHAAASLIKDHGYGLNLMNMMTLSPGDVAFFDHNMASWMFQTVYACWDAFTTDTVPMSAAELALFKSQVDAAFDLHLRVVILFRNSYYTSFLFDITKDVANATFVGASAWGLHREPLELIWWPDRSGDRLDVLLDKDYARCCRQDFSYLPVPKDEAGEDGMGTNYYRVDTGNPHSENDPNKKLLGYWLTRYCVGK